MLRASGPCPWLNPAKPLNIYEADGQVQRSIHLEVPKASLLSCLLKTCHLLTWTSCLLLLVLRVCGLVLDFTWEAPEVVNQQKLQSLNSQPFALTPQPELSTSRLILFSNLLILFSLYGCTGSPLLWVGFLQLQRVGTTP